MNKVLDGLQAKAASPLRAASAAYSTQKKKSSYYGQREE